MDEFDPDASIQLNMADGREIEMNRFNSGLFTFIGKNAVGEDIRHRNHIYVEYTTEEDKYGSYIFACSGVFKQIAQFALINDFPCFLNANSVPESDEAAYQMMLDKEITDSESDFGGDYFPEDWDKAS